MSALNAAMWLQSASAALGGRIHVAKYIIQIYIRKI
jgi:hypothetical protein